MNLQSLPPELILSITTHIPNTSNLYAPLCQVSHYFYNITITALYRANIRNDYNSALQWASIYNLPHLTRDMLAHAG
ncbi:ankyrin [Aspergillus affinis]|uniref:ankyrin n=1 Tax=Aspergillus affinis TaxID=1070780 RepID=UPI0022FF1714|nr:ankyrin [Aspergillus affinis]KAI9044745.1 ankyrin [Aspergillus affinis]